MLMHVMLNVVFLLTLVCDIHARTYATGFPYVKGWQKVGVLPSSKFTFGAVREGLTVKCLLKSNPQKFPPSKYTRYTVCTD